MSPSRFDYDYSTADWGSRETVLQALGSIPSADGTSPPVAVGVNTFVDELWSGTVPIDWKERKVFEYYDYYFTGEDIQIYIEGLDLDDFDAKMPIMNFYYRISQQKLPIYGFWSYSFDEIMRGTRIVEGGFTIATRSTDYMTRVISKAAARRSVGRNVEHKLRGNTRDESNIEKYWGNHIEAHKNVTKNMHSIHPPFNFIIVYGISDVSLCADDADTNSYVTDYYNTPLVDDDNDILYEVDSAENQMRRIIQNVEITGMTSGYSPNGNVCSEQYTFIARDMYPAGSPENIGNSVLRPVVESEYPTYGIEPGSFGFQ